MDFIARVVEQWATIHPELDTTPLQTVGRLTRIAALLHEEAERQLEPAGLSRAEFDLLCALRRTGTPVRAREASMMTSASAAAITKRVDRLGRIGLVLREVPPADRRGALVSLTEAGEELVDRLLVEELEREHQAVAGLTPDELEALATILSRMLVRTELMTRG